MRKLYPHEIERVDAQALAALERHPLAVVLDDIRSAYNVGAILRTADAIRAAMVVCCGLTPSPDHQSVAKTALGAEQTVPWRVVEDPVTALVALKKDGYRIAALEHTDAPTRIRDIRPGHFPIALVVGNEVTGVQQRVLDACDVALELPQFGAKASLNVSIAFGVAAYGLLDVLLGNA